MKTQLFLMTHIFPFGKGETFLEAELPILAKRFERVHIICENIEDEQTRATPENVEIHRFRPILSKFQKFTSLNKFFKSEVIKEVGFILRNQKPADYFSCLKVLLDSAQQSEQTSRYLLSLVKQYKNDHQKLVFYSYWLTNTSLALANLKREIPNNAICISRAHRWDIYFDFHSPPYLPLKKYIIKNLDRVYSISEDGQKYMETFLEDSKKSNIDISRLGVFNHFDLEPQVPSDEKKELKIVSCSAIIERKRVHLIMEAIALLPENIKVHWYHIGDGPLLENMEQRAKDLQNKNPNIKIDFLGYLPNQEALDFYSNNYLDLFVNTSDSEGIPVSIMEAMSFYIPCAGTEVGGVAEIIETGFNGFLLSPNPSANEITDCFLQYFRLSEAKKMQLRQYARQTWEKKYNAEQNYDAFSTALLSL